MADEYIKRRDVLIKLEIAYDMARLDQKLPISDLQHEVNLIKSADVQPLSVAAEHIKNRLYETALNTNGAESDTIAAMAERIDFWISELKDGEQNERTV